MVQRRPHILRAAKNPRKMLENIKHLVDDSSYDSILEEIRRNVIGLFNLGDRHFRFAEDLCEKNWRQRISRCYYGCYNVRRAIQLDYKGIYRTDVGDHKDIDNLPNELPNQNTYSRRLVDLRSDRNIADYDHCAEEEDLVLSQSEALSLTEDFIEDSHSFLSDRGVPL